MKTHLRSMTKRKVSDFRPAHRLLCRPKFLILIYGLCMFIFIGDEDVVEKWTGFELVNLTRLSSVPRGMGIMKST